MSMHHVKITETLTMTVEVEADNELRAEQQVHDKWRNGEYVLDSDNFAGVTFESINNEKAPAKSGFSFNRLEDYISNWISLMQNNNHLQETERVKAERIKILTDACACIIRLERVLGEMAALKTILGKIS